MWSVRVCVWGGGDCRYQSKLSRTQCNRARGLGLGFGCRRDHVLISHTSSPAIARPTYSSHVRSVQCTSASLPHPAASLRIPLHLSTSLPHPSNPSPIPPHLWENYPTCNAAAPPRCDFRVDGATGEIHLLEINPNCGVLYPPGLHGSAGVCTGLCVCVCVCVCVCKGVCKGVHVCVCMHS